MILEIEGLQKHFGGVQAVNRIDLTVRKGELHSVIGPNGSGKTTLFHLISGFHRSDGGRVLFNGEDITNLRAERIWQKGIARVFQRTSLFRRLSVMENVRVAILSRAGKRWDFFSQASKLATEETLKVLDAVGLSPQRATIADTLAHGDQRRLELAICLAGGPKLMLLDEPTSGVSPEEVFGMVELIGKMNREQGFSILFIEHDMDVVFSISHTISVMHQGNIIAQGKPEEIRNNDEVQRIYLGERE